MTGEGIMRDQAQAWAEELKLRPEQAAGAISLLREGAPAPFIARYRRERTGGLGEPELAALKERLGAESALEARRVAILSSIRAQGKLDEALRVRLEAARSRAELEDLYLPFSPRGKGPGESARERGLAPLAELIARQASSAGTAEEAAAEFLSAEKGVKEASAALAGARALLAEEWASDPDLRAAMRRLVWTEGQLATRLTGAESADGGKYAAFASFSAPLGELPPHRLLAIIRGEGEKKLALAVRFPREKALELLRARRPAGEGSPFREELEKALVECFERLLQPEFQAEVRKELKHRADRAALEVFGRALRSLMLHPPLGRKPVLVVFHDSRLGARLAVVAADGKLAERAPFELVEAPDSRAATPATQPVPEPPAGALDSPPPAAPAPPLDPAREPPRAADEERKAAELAGLVRKHAVFCVVVCAGREARVWEAFVRRALAAGKLEQVLVMRMSESGAAAYAATRAARDDAPDADPGARAALSVGRRLQDPLAELVKLPPSSIGVGQYQRDLDPKALARKLDEAVESCVNLVGVDVNSAGPELLRHVSGLGPNLAQSVVETRARNGGFKSREELRTVPAFGPKAFELSAPFLRIRGGSNPLDATAIHPERYGLVEKMAKSLNLSVPELLGRAEHLAKLDLKAFEDEGTCEATLRDLVEELRRPGRDPRGPFVPPVWNPEVTDLRALQPGQVLNGAVTNLTSFGAFVDLGLQQDGLVHISELAHRFVKDPAQVVQVGQPVKVKVLSVDLEKRRISLSIKALESTATARPPRGPREASVAETPRPPRRPPPAGQVAPPADATTPAMPPAAPPVAAPPPPSAVPPLAASAPAAATLASGAARKRPPYRKEAGAREREPKSGRTREQPAPPAPGKPDYAKFYVQTKRKEKTTAVKRADEASQTEIRQTMRSQEKSGHTLGALLEKAGLTESQDDGADAK